MIIVCSSCKACYLVPASTFAAGPRQVRCARCGHVWQADLPPKTTAIPWEDPPAPPTIEKKKVGPAAERGREVSPSETGKPNESPSAQLPALRGKNWIPFWRKVGILLAGLFVLMGVLWLFLAGPLRHLTLPSAKPAAALSLRDVISERRFENGAMQLVVDGKILNETDHTQAIPEIEASALAPDGKKIQGWKIAPPAAKIQARGSLAFHSAVSTQEGTIAAVNLKWTASPTPQD